MKAWNKIMMATIAGVVMLMLVANIQMLHMQRDDIPNDALVSVNRAYAQLQKGSDIQDIELDSIHFQHIEEDELALTTYMEEGSKHIVVLPASDGGYYRFTYRIERIPVGFIGFLNGIFLALLGLLVYSMLFIKRQIIQPFHNMEHMAQALTNRDFSYELPQQKYRFFGKFVWAVDVLKEELRSHEKKELSLMKEKQTMISSLSHDIKTPLSNIRLYTDALSEQLYPLELIQERIYENCAKIDHYVKDIMSTSNEKLFDFSVHMQEFYLDEIMTLLKREEERIALAFVDCHITPIENAMIYGDLARLREVISNVVDNALKYGDGKWIRMSFYEEDAHVILQIENSGQQIDKNDVSAIYQSFYRGHHLHPKEGHGLGLYICKQLMQQMEGDIFMSQKEGSVSFHIVFGAI